MNSSRGLFFLMCLLGFLGSVEQSFGQNIPVEEKLIQFNYKKEKKVEKKFEILLELGEYYKTHNLRKADSLKTIILEKSPGYSERLRYKSLLFNAEVDLLNGNRNGYFNAVVGFKPLLNVLKEDTIQFQIIKHLGNYYSMIGDYAEADTYLRKSIRLAKKTRSKVAAAESYIFLSRSFMMRFEKDSALYYIDKAIENARRSSNKQILAESIYTQAEVYRHFGQVDLSVAKNIIAIQMATELNDSYKISKYSREIGRSQLNIKNLDDASYYFKQSLKYSVRLSDDHQYALALSDLGTIAFEKKQFGQAVSLNEQAIAVLDRLQDQEGLGNAHNNLGMIYREQKNFTKAASNFNQALIYYESIGNKEQIATVFHNVGTVFLAQKKHSNALNYLNKSIAIRQQNGANSQMYNTYRVISDVYRDLGQKEKSLDFLTIYIDYVDSNAASQSATKIAELSELYRAEQRDRLITSQQESLQKQQQERAIASTKLENAQLRSRFQMYVIGGFLLLILFAGILVYSRWKQTELRQQQREAEMAQTLLRAQMNPHFIFNAMSVIQSYIYENDTVNSSKFLVNFSRLMRLILENSSKEEIPIETEEEILRKYLETQKLRFEDRFDFVIEIDDILVDESANIPPMITQPFIENSIEHGQLHKIVGGFIHVRFSKQDNMLNITIEDNGIGRKGAEQNKKSKDHKSMAMQITSDRINNLNKKFKTEGFVVVEDFDKALETGTKVLISLPYRTDSQITI